MACEVSITVKNDERRQTSRSLVYDKFQCDMEDALLKSLLDAAVADFNDEVDDIQIKIKLQVK